VRGALEVVVFAGQLEWRMLEQGLGWTTVGMSEEVVSLFKDTDEFLDNKMPLCSGSRRWYAMVL
jgi:hypothetical protein